MANTSSLPPTLQPEPPPAWSSKTSDEWVGFDAIDDSSCGSDVGDIGISDIGFDYSHYHEGTERVFEVPTDTESFEALASLRKRHHTLVRFVGAPAVGDAIRVAEVVGKGPTGRACFARVTYVEVVSQETVVLSLDIRMSTDRLNPSPTSSTPRMFAVRDDDKPSKE
jgi:hypothetical protein